MSRLGFANIYELLDESDSSGVETGKKAQEALEKKNAAAAAALAPTPKPASTQKPTGERKQGGNNESRGPRTDRPRGDRPPRAEGDRPRGDRPPRTDRPQGERPPRAEGDRPRRPQGPRPAPDSPQLEGAETNFNESGQAAAGAPRPNLPRGQKGGPRGDRGYERRNTGDQDQRPRREFDRRSGTGRGKEVSKGGAGKGNWGSVDEETNATAEGSAAEIAAAEDVKKEGEEGAVEAAPVEPIPESEPEEPPVRTLDDYLSQRKKVASALPAPRRAGEGEDEGAFKGYTQFAREEETLFSVDKSSKDRKAKEAKESSQKKVSADQVLRFQDKERGDRRESRGDDRRGGRGGQGRGQQKRTAGAAPNFGDKSAFPTLSTKA